MYLENIDSLNTDARCSRIYKYRYFEASNYILHVPLPRDINISNKGAMYSEFFDTIGETIKRSLSSLYLRSVRTSMPRCKTSVTSFHARRSPPRGCAGHVVHGCTALRAPRESFIKVARGFFLIDTNVLASSNPSAKGRLRINPSRSGKMKRY